MVEFSDQATVKIPLTKSFDSEVLKNLVDEIKLSDSEKRDVDLALDVVKTEVLSTKGGARSDVPRSVVLVTAGKSTGRVPVDYAAEPLKKDGVKIYVVGVGDTVDPDEFTNVVGNTSDIHQVNKPEDTSTVVTKITDSIKKDQEKGTFAFLSRCKHFQLLKNKRLVWRLLYLFYFALNSRENSLCKIPLLLVFALKYFTCFKLHKKLHPSMLSSW